MFLKHIELKNYRNYGSCSIEFATPKTILVGKNAQGKTNLLESVYYMSTLSSYRSSPDAELIKWGNDYAFLKAEVIKNDTDIDLSVLINPPKNKVLKVNGLKKSKYSQFLGNLLSVSFGVNDLLILRGSPQDRRHWLDLAISQLYPAYRDRLLKYNKIRTQRNNTLKDFKGNINLASYQEDLISVWDEQLVVTGSNVIHLRIKYLKEIQRIANEKHSSIAKGENLVINYNSAVTGQFDCEKDETIPVEKIADNFKRLLAEKRNEEIIRAQTVAGPHRDDICFFINGINAESFASQGQQRTVVLSLKLAELEFIRRIVNENPILLLDDVLAELDTTRQNYLLDTISEETQTIITTVDLSGFSKDYLNDVMVYNVEAGTVSSGR